MSEGEFLLTDRLRECTWTLTQRQTAQYARGGASQVLNLGDPFWSISAVYENLGEDEYRELLAWVSRRRGAVVTFAAPRPARSPVFAQDPIGTIVTKQGPKLWVNTGATEQVRVGDMVSYTGGSGRYIGEILATAPAFGNNIECTMSQHPVDFDLTPDVAIAGAWGLFRMDPTSLQSSETYDLRKRVSFSARQVEP